MQNTTPAVPARWAFRDVAVAWRGSGFESILACSLHENQHGSGGRGALFGGGRRTVDGSGWEWMGEAGRGW